MRYRFVQQHVGKFPVVALCLVALCRVLQLTRSGFSAWQKRQPRQPQQEDERLLVQIRQFFEQSRGTYGSPRVLRDLRDLREEGFLCGKHRVARLMRQAGLRAVLAPRFRVRTDSKHALPVAQNVLDRDFEAPAANIQWASDVTYLWTGEGWLYLAVVLDLFSRRIIGWSMQASRERSLVMNALQGALSQRRPEIELLHHSDRGSQYASREFQEMLSEQGTACSMSRKANCWDNAPNAPVESFFGTLKQERVHRCHFATREVARQEVFAYIEILC